MPTYPLPRKLFAPLPVPVCALLSSNSLESTSAPSDPDAEPGKELVEGVNVAAGAGWGFASGAVNVVELPVEVEADDGLLEMRGIRGSNAARSVYLSIRETIVGRKSDVKKEDSHASPNTISCQSQWSRARRLT
jgi:hypothetical protein